MQLITTYSPGSFLKPCIVFSTLYYETAVCFVEALHGSHALKQIFSGMESESLKKSEWIVIKKHKSPAEALAYHNKIALTYRNGEGDKLWNKGRKPYIKLWEKYCPPELKMGACFRANLSTVKEISSSTSTTSYRYWVSK